MIALVRMRLDPSTLYTVVVAVASAAAFLFWTTSRRSAVVTSALPWSLAFALVAGYFAAALVSRWLPPALGFGVANGLAVALMAAMHRAACVLTGEPFRWPGHATAVAVVTLVIVACFTDPIGGYDARVQLVGAVTALQCGLVAATMLRPAPGIGGDELAGRRVAAAVFAALGVVQAGRALAHSPLVRVDEPAILAQTALSAGAATGFLLWSVAVPVLVFYIHEARARQALRTTVGELQAALTEVQSLRALLPMCAGCRRIRHDGTRWSPLETYLVEQAGVRMTHGICPECMRRLYPEFVDPDLR
jgi:hypothetical protein